MATIEIRINTERHRRRSGWCWMFVASVTRWEGAPPPPSGYASVDRWNQDEVLDFVSPMIQGAFEPGDVIDWNGATFRSPAEAIRALIDLRSTWVPSARRRSPEATRC